MTTRAQRSAKSPKIEALIGQDRELLKALVKEAVQEVLEAEMISSASLGRPPQQHVYNSCGSRWGAIP